MLYGLNQAPQLHVLANWSEVHYLAVPNDSYKVTSLPFSSFSSMELVSDAFLFLLFSFSIGYSI